MKEGTGSCYVKEELEAVTWVRELKDVVRRGELKVVASENDCKLLCEGRN